MRIRFGLTLLALTMAMLAGNGVRGQSLCTHPDQGCQSMTGSMSGRGMSGCGMSGCCAGLQADCCADKQQSGDCCSQPCSKTGCCAQGKCASGKKCCDKGCCQKGCCEKSGCCTGTPCSKGKRSSGCCGKTVCPMCKAGKCCKGAACKSSQAKSYRALGCCAAAMVRTVVPLPPLPVMMPLLLPPEALLSVMRLQIYSSDPNKRILEMVNDNSEELRQIETEWERVWFADQPSHLTPERVHGGIGCCEKSSCCTGTACSKGKCCSGCCGKTACPMCKAGKCCKGTVCKSQAKSCRALGCCAGAMVRTVVPLPPLPVMMPLPLPPLPPEALLSVVRIRAPQVSRCPYCQMMGIPTCRPCVTAPVTIGMPVPAKGYALIRSESGVLGYAPTSGVHEYAVEVRRMEKVGREVCEQMACPRVTLEENQPVRVQIAGQLILGDAGLNCKAKESTAEQLCQCMIHLLVRSCGAGKVCVGVETDQLQPPASGSEYGVGFRRCMRLVKTVELDKPTRVVLERGPKGNVRSWLEITVRKPGTQSTADGKVTGKPEPSCGVEASEAPCLQPGANVVCPTLAALQEANRRAREWLRPPCPASCNPVPALGSVWAPVPFGNTLPPPLPPPAPMQMVWQGPQPITPPVPPLPPTTALPPPLPVASSPEPMPPPVPVPPPAPTVAPPSVSPFASPDPLVSTPSPACPAASAELRCVELSVVEEKGKQVLRLETGAMRLTCEQITLEPKGQGRITLCASDHQVCIKGKTMQARADRVKVEEASTFSLMGKVQVHTDLGGPTGKGVVSDTRSQGSSVRVNMLDGGITIRQVGR